MSRFYTCYGCDVDVGMGESICMSCLQEEADSANIESNKLKDQIKEYKSQIEFLVNTINNTSGDSAYVDWVATDDDGNIISVDIKQDYVYNYESSDCDCTIDSWVIKTIRY